VAAVKTQKIMNQVNPQTPELNLRYSMKSLGLTSPKLFSSGLIKLNSFLPVDSEVGKAKADFSSLRSSSFYASFLSACKLVALLNNPKVDCLFSFRFAFLSAANWISTSVLVLSSS